MPDAVRRDTTAATLAHSIAARFGIVALNAVTGILTARLLSPEGRGELAAMSLWPVLVAGLTTLGLPSALVYHGRHNPARLRALTASALALAAVAGAAGTAVAWTVIPMWLAQHPPAVVAAARYCLLGAVVNAVIVTGRAGLEARGDFRLSNLSQVATPAMTIVILVILAETGRLTPITAAAAYVGVGLPVLLWMLVTLGGGAAAAGRVSLPAEWPRLLHYGARSYGVDLFGVLALYLDQALVVGMLAPGAMGIYAVALSVSRIINAVQGAVATLMFPTVVGFPRDELTRTIARSARLSALAAGAIGMVVVALGPVLVGLLYGSEYMPAGTLLPLLVLQVVLAGIVQVLLQGLLASGHPGGATLTQFAGLALGVPLFLVLVPLRGAQGAAMALLASTAIRLGLTMACYRFWLRAPFPRLWIDRSDLTYLGARLASFLRAAPAARLREGAAE